MNEFPILGYDIGGTKIAVALMMNDGKVITSERFDNMDTDPEKMLPKLAECGLSMLKTAGISSSAVPGIGISTPSPADIPNGIITAPPNNPKWRNVEIGKFLSEQLNSELKPSWKMMPTPECWPNGFSAPDAAAAMQFT